jgi:hypothetical protein
MEPLRIKRDETNNPPLKLSTSGSYKVINDLNKSPIEYRQNITLMVTIAKNIAKKMNANDQWKATNYRVHVKQDNKLVCIVSKNDIEWQPDTELIQERYFPESDLAKRIEQLFVPPPVVKDEDINNEEIDDAMFKLLNFPNFR